MGVVVRELFWTNPGQTGETRETYQINKPNLPHIRPNSLVDTAHGVDYDGVLTLPSCHEQDRAFPICLFCHFKGCRERSSGLAYSRRSCGDKISPLPEDRETILHHRSLSFSEIAMGDESAQSVSVVERHIGEPALDPPRRLGP